MDTPLILLLLNGFALDSDVDVDPSMCKPRLTYASSDELNRRHSAARSSHFLSLLQEAHSHVTELDPASLFLECQGNVAHGHLGHTEGDIRSWLFIFRAGEDPTWTHLISYDTQERKWSDVTTLKFPWLQDSVIKVEEITMGPEEAISLLRKSGFKSPFQSVMIRKSTKPSVHEAHYVFSMPTDMRMVLVGVQSGAVSH